MIRCTWRCWCGLWVFFVRLVVGRHFTVAVSALRNRQSTQREQLGTKQTAGNKKTNKKRGVKGTSRRRDARKVTHGAVRYESESEGTVRSSRLLGVLIPLVLSVSVFVRFVRHYSLMDVGCLLESAFDRGSAFYHRDAERALVLASYEARRAEEDSANQTNAIGTATAVGAGTQPNNTQHPTDTPQHSPSASLTSLTPLSTPVDGVASSVPLTVSSPSASLPPSNSLTSLLATINNPALSIEVVGEELLAKLRKYSSLGPRWGHASSAAAHNTSATHDSNTTGGMQPNNRTRRNRPLSGKTLTLWRPLDADGLPLPPEDPLPDGATLYDEMQEWILARRAIAEKVKKASDLDRRKLQHASRVKEFQAKQKAEREAAERAHLLAAGGEASDRPASPPDTHTEANTTEPTFDFKAIFGITQPLLPFEKTLLRDRYNTWVSARNAAITQLHGERTRRALADWAESRAREAARRASENLPAETPSEIDSSRRLALSSLKPIESTLIPIPIPMVTFDVPPATLIQAKQTMPFSSQGDPNMYTDVELDSRASLRSHPKLLRLIDQFWRTFNEKDSKLGLVKREYLDVHVRMQKAILRDLDNNAQQKEREENLAEERQRKNKQHKSKQPNAINASAGAVPTHSPTGAVNKRTIATYDSKGNLKGGSKRSTLERGTTPSTVAIDTDAQPAPALAESESSSSLVVDGAVVPSVLPFVDVSPVVSVPTILKSIPPLPHSLWDGAEADRLALRDWTRDTHRSSKNGTNGIKLQQFQDALFELVDLWTETTDPNEYAEFMTVLYSRIARPAQVGVAGAGAGASVSTGGSGVGKKPVALSGIGQVAPGKWRPLREMPFEGHGIEDIWMRFLEKEKSKEAARLRGLLAEEAARRASEPQTDEAATTGGVRSNRRKSSTMNSIDGDDDDDYTPIDSGQATPSAFRDLDKRRARRSVKIARVKRKDRIIAGGAGSTGVASGPNSAANTKSPQRRRIVHGDDDSQRNQIRTIAIIEDGIKKRIEVPPHERVVYFPEDILKHNTNIATNNGTTTDEKSVAPPAPSSSSVDASLSASGSGPTVDAVDPSLTATDVGVAGHPIAEGDESYEWIPVYEASHIDDDGETVFVRRMKRMPIQAEEFPARRTIIESGPSSESSPTTTRRRVKRQEAYELPRYDANGNMVMRAAARSSGTPSQPGSGSTSPLIQSRRRSVTLVAGEPLPAAAVKPTRPSYRPDDRKVHPFSFDHVIGLGRGVTGTKQPKRLSKRNSRRGSINNNNPTDTDASNADGQPEPTEVIDPVRAAFEERVRLLSGPEPPRPPPKCPLTDTEEEILRRRPYESRAMWLKRLEEECGYDRLQGTIELISTDGVLTLREFDHRASKWKVHRDRIRWQERHALTEAEMEAADQLIQRYDEAVREAGGAAGGGATGDRTEKDQLQIRIDAGDAADTKENGVTSQSGPSPNLLSPNGMVGSSPSRVGSSSSLVSSSSSDVLAPAWDPNHPSPIATKQKPTNTGKSRRPSKARHSVMQARATTTDKRVRDQINKIQQESKRNDTDQTDDEQDDGEDEDEEEEEEEYDSDVVDDSPIDVPVETPAERRARRLARRRLKKAAARAFQLSSSLAQPDLLSAQAAAIVAGPRSPAEAQRGSLIWKHLAREMALAQWQKHQLRIARRTSVANGMLKKSTPATVFEVAPLAVRVGANPEHGRIGHPHSASALTPTELIPSLPGVMPRRTNPIIRALVGSMELEDGTTTATASDGVPVHHRSGDSIEIDPELLQASLDEYHHVAGMHQFSTPAGPFRKYSLLIHPSMNTSPRRPSHMQVRARGDTQTRQMNEPTMTDGQESESSLSSRSGDDTDSGSASDDAIPVTATTPIAGSSPPAHHPLDDPRLPFDLSSHPLHWSQTAEEHEAQRNAEDQSQQRARMEQVKGIQQATAKLREAEGQHRPVQRRTSTAALTKARRESIASTTSTSDPSDLVIHSGASSRQLSRSGSPSKTMRGSVSGGGLRSTSLSPHRDSAVSSAAASLVGVPPRVDWSTMSRKLDRLMLASQLSPGLIVIDQPERVRKILEEDEEEEKREIQQEEEEKKENEQATQAEEASDHTDTSFDTDGASTIYTSDEDDASVNRLHPPELRVSSAISGTRQPSKSSSKYMRPIQVPHVPPIRPTPQLSELHLTFDGGVAHGWDTRSMTELSDSPLVASGRKAPLTFVPSESASNMTGRPDAPHAPAHVRQPFNIHPGEIRHQRRRRQGQEGTTTTSSNDPHRHTNNNLPPSEQQHADKHFELLRGKLLDASIDEARRRFESGEAEPSHSHAVSVSASDEKRGVSPPRRASSPHAHAIGPPLGARAPAERDWLGRFYSVLRDDRTHTHQPAINFEPQTAREAARTTRAREIAHLHAKADAASGSRTTRVIFPPLVDVHGVGARVSTDNVECMNRLKKVARFSAVKHSKLLSTTYHTVHIKTQRDGSPTRILPARNNNDDAHTMMTTVTSNTPSESPANPNPPAFDPRMITFAPPPATAPAGAGLSSRVGVASHRTRHGASVLDPRVSRYLSSLSKLADQQAAIRQQHDEIEARYKTHTHGNDASQRSTAYVDSTQQPMKYAGRTLAEILDEANRRRRR